MGCGPGESALQIARALGGFAQVVGIDIGRDFAPLVGAIARRNHISARFAAGSCLALPVAAGAASVVVSLEMVEHVPDWPRFLAEAARVLEAGGLLLVSTPNPLGLHSLLKWPYRRLRGFDTMNRAFRRAGDFYERFISVGELTAATRGAGLVPLEIAYGGHAVTFAPDRALPALVAAERVLEGRGWAERLAVTTFLVARKPG